MIESLGHYKVLEQIGSGTMGDLFRARDTRVGRTVALRVVSPAIAQDQARLRMLLHDARAAAAVSHPNIAAIYDVAEDGGHYYLACEFVQGQKLKSLVSGRPLNPRRAIDLTIQIADALADADASGVAHGDLRGDTIIVNAKGNAKLLDFGLSRWTSAPRAGGAGGPRAAGAPDATGSANATGGTDADRIEGREATGAAAHRSDIAALGLVLHEMLTGALPRDQSPPSASDAALPRELDAIVRNTQPSAGAAQYEASATLAAELRAVAAILEERARGARAAAAVVPAGARRREALVWTAAIAMIAVFAWLVWAAAGAR